MRAARWAVLLALASAPAAALGPGDAAGDWVGSYTCTQGLTALDLTIKVQGKNELRALFHFRPDPSNPDVPEGCYEMTGAVDTGKLRIFLDPDTWLLRPPGYAMVGLMGQLSDDRITGFVNFPGCTTFDLTRAAIPPERTLACSPPGLMTRALRPVAYGCEPQAASVRSRWIAPPAPMTRCTITLSA